MTSILQAEGEDEKAEEEPYEEEDLYEKAEKEFFSIIEAEKKKQPTPSQDFAEVEKAVSYYWVVMLYYNICI